MKRFERVFWFANGAVYGIIFPISFIYFPGADGVDYSDFLTAAVMILFVPILFGLYIYTYKVVVLHKEIQYVERLAWFLFFSTVLLSFVITTYAYLYLHLQAIEPLSEDHLDYLYFSMVTFTTLGYGDFSPVNNYRILAASEALIGYIYLGSIVGFLTSIISREEKR